MPRRPKGIGDCYNIEDLRELARRRLPAALFDYLDGGAETEFTARRNTQAFDEQRLIPRGLVDVRTVSTRVRILGQELAWPMMCSPTGGSRFYHPDGEFAVARATAATGTLYGVSVMGTHALEAVAAAGNGPKVFQALIFKDRAFTQELVVRAKRAGYPALCLTIDAAPRGKRERELRTGLGLPLRLSVQSAAMFALRPGWCIGQLRRGPLSLANLAERVGRGLARQSQFAASQLEPSGTWKDARDLADLWSGPFAIKGILCADDARRAVDAGATAVIVSNHGGRQLDGAAAAVEMLPEIVQAVGARTDVILDGGIRRGTHVLKALALGAKACSVGRAYLFGLAAGGEAGVVKALETLKNELINSMKLCGCTDASQIARDLVKRF